MIEIKERGAAELAAKLARMGASMRPTLEQAMKKAVLYVHSTVPPYPAANAESTYRRTETLGRTVTSMQGAGPQALSRVESLGGQVRGIVGTALEYAPFVIDENRQAGQHRGRWWTLQKVVRDAQDGIRKIFEQAIRGLVRQ